MVDFAALPKNAILDARDRETLSDLLAPASKQANEIKPPFALSTLATMPVMTTERFTMVIDRVKAELDKLLDLNREAQDIVKNFKPKHPLVDIAYNQPLEL